MIQVLNLETGGAIEKSKRERAQLLLRPPDAGILLYAVKERNVVARAGLLNLEKPLIVGRDKEPSEPRGIVSKNDALAAG